EQPRRIYTRAFARQTRRQKIFTFRRLVERQILHDRALSDLNLVTAHAVVLLDHPPAVLNILTALILWRVEERRRNVRTLGSDASQKESCQRSAPFRSQIRLGHLQLIFRILLLALIVERRLFDLSLEETLVVVPG